MKLVILSVYDSAARTYTSPQCVVATGQGVRAFTDQVRAGDNNIVALHPEDFALYRLGVFDDETGAVEPMEKAELVVRGVDVKTPA